MQVDWPEFLSIFPGSLSDVKTETKAFTQKCSFYMGSMNSNCFDKAQNKVRKQMCTLGNIWSGRSRDTIWDLFKMQVQKFFTENDALQKHDRIHTAIREKPFSCPNCEKSFVHNQSLKTHENIYTGAKSLACSLFEKSYSIILLTENAQKRGWLAFPGYNTRYTLSRHPKTVRICSAWEGVPSITARKGQ